MTHRIDIIGVLLVLAAVAVGLWLGLTGPDISPIITEARIDGGPADGDGGGR